jgi:hypothetical protein
MVDSEVELEPIVVQTTGNDASKPVAIRLAFEDIRRDKTSVGVIRNGYLAHTANIVPKTDVEAWVRQSLVSHLKQHGYRLRLSGETSDDLIPTIDISVRLYRVYSDFLAQFQITGEVQAIFAVTKASARTKETIIDGAARSDVSMMLIASNYHKALELALKDFLAKSLVWVDRQAMP